MIYQDLTESRWGTKGRGWGIWLDYQGWSDIECGDSCLTDLAEILLKLGDAEMDVYKSKGWGLAEKKVHRSPTKVCSRRVFWQFKKNIYIYISKVLFRGTVWVKALSYNSLFLQCWDLSNKWFDLRNEFCLKNAVQISPLCYWLWLWYISSLDPPWAWRALRARTHCPGRAGQHVAYCHFLCSSRMYH